MRKVHEVLAVYDHVSNVAIPRLLERFDGFRYALSTCLKTPKQSKPLEARRSLGISTPLSNRRKHTQTTR